MALFVPYIPSYEKDFLVSAIKKIKDNSSTEYLAKYWSVLPNPIWIRETVNKEEHFCRDFAIYISQHADRFLCDKVYRDTFCEALKSLGDDDFYLSILEKFIKSGQDFKDAYITHILYISKLQSKTNSSLLIVNRGLSNVESDKLITVKKHLISDLINEGQLDDAENEIKSILNKDSEAPTLLVELYWGRTAVTPNNQEKIEWLFRLLDVDENNTLQERARKLIEQSLIELTNIAKSEYNSNNKEVTYAIAERVKGHFDYWIPLYIWLRNNDRVEETTLNQNIKYDYETLKEIKRNCPSSKEFNNDDFNILWKNYSDNVIKKAKAQPLDKAIDGLESLREFEKNSCPKSIENILLQETSSILIKTKWTLGLEKEQDADYSEAIKLYDEIASDCIPSFVTRAKLRSLISHVKSNNVDSTVEYGIEEALKIHSYQTLKEDLAFRYACYLLQCIRPSDAERIIRTYLPEETQILDICENVYVKEAEKNLETFNSLVNKMNEGRMSLSEAIEFKQNIQSFKKKIIGKLTDLSRSFGVFQPKVEDYILHKMFEEEAYSDLLTKMMVENPNYIENDVDFRNIAIASLGLLESDINNTSILKRAIATILTAIYSDRLFVQSLDQTSWDDKYTFTLDGSFGGSSIDDYEELPENVNFDYAVENVNIAIRDVQNSLLTRVETVVRKKHPELEKFLTDEKNALDKIIELNLDKDFILASPHLCRTLASIRMSIENSFEYELNQNYGNREEVIALGVDYGFHGGEYDEYRKAYNSLLFCKSSVSSTPAATPSATFTQDKITLIKRYDRLYSDLKSSVATAMNNDIKSDMDYRNFLDKYEVPCCLLKDTSLSYTCTNYVNGKIIQLLNSKNMKLRDGVGYMVRLYNIAPTNEQIKNNTEGIVTSLVHEAEKSNSRADRLALNNAISNLHGAFGKEISLASIIAKVNNDRIEEYQALTQIYDLYTKNLNSAEICENLATIVKICIHKYFAGDTYSGRSEVRQTLNKLKTNKSATFREKAKVLALEYLKIMKDMPQDMRLLLMAGVSLSGSTLSSKGQLLKEGLDYMKDLGNVDELLRKH